MHFVLKPVFTLGKAIIRTNIPSSIILKTCLEFGLIYSANGCINLFIILLLKGRYLYFDEFLPTYR